MTNLPDDLLDPTEARLIRRVRGYTDQAIVPVDAMAVASGAVRSRPRRARGFAGLWGSRRLGWVVAGAALATVVAAGAIGAGGLNGLRLGTATVGTPSPTLIAEPSVTPDAAATCAVADLHGRIVAWDGAAGSRLATVELTSSAAAFCRLPSDPRLTLIDAMGRVLIQGPYHRQRLFISPRETLHSLVEVSNACVAFEPSEPATIVWDGAMGEIVFAPAAGGLSGIPPCNGAGSAGSISQQPWQPGPATD